MKTTPKADPITDAVEQLIASIPATRLEDKPLMQAFLNWCRSQEVSQDEMCMALCTLLGLFIGMRAESKADLKAGLAIYAKQMRSAASVSMEAKEFTGEP
jgi:hypothetical protein